MSDYEIHLVEEVLAGRMTRRQLVTRASGLGLSLPAIAALLAACGGEGQPTGGKAKKGGIFRIGLTQQIDTINPFVALDDNSLRVFRYAYPALVKYDLKFEQIPDFATEWEQSSDGRTITFRTAAGAKWSDGQPLTARDAAWTIQTIVKFKEGPTAFLASNADHVTDVEAPDPTTLVISHDQPIGLSLALYKLSQIYILPEHIWTTHAAGDGAGLRDFQNPAPVVSGGPFILKEHRRKEFTFLESNSNYYGRKPRIDGAGFRFYESTDAVLTALTSDEIDLVDLLGEAAIRGLKDEGFVVGEMPGFVFNDFIFNSNPKKTRNRELLDPKVRLALDHAVDRQQIADVALRGAGEPGDAFIPPSLGGWHNSNITAVPFDLNLANQILDQAGYSRGPDGVRLAGDHKMEYEVLEWSELLGRDRIFQLLQVNWDKIGIKVKQRILDSAGLFAGLTAPNNKYLDFDLGMWDWVSNPDPDFVLSVLTCAQWGAWSDTGYCNDEYDKLYSQQSTAVDEEDRETIIWQMQEKIFNERPYLVLAYLDATSAHSPKWAGLTMTPVGFLQRTSTDPLTRVHQVA